MKCRNYPNPGEGMRRGRQGIGHAGPGAEGTRGLLSCLSEMEEGRVVPEEASSPGLRVSCPGLHCRRDGTPLTRLICWG